ncbi:MAG: ATP-dependent RNA helicase RhlE [Deltaproteobacteria bacterium HGW-Deltaproteobacteria-22]|jgi:ATP-dependent RNA helicase RhlE|nr:MAG: ATP-dependent RNA helicase RhlE [Deltaproteobacteria bacterium HGW-Deltaproteobacteria-22]
MSFSSLGLRAELLQAITEEGYTVPTPVQSQTIPIVLSGKDVMAGAQTGTGKTAAFALPILQILSENRPLGRRPRLRALVLTPTRELAAQVAESFKDYGRHLPLTTGLVFGGVGIGPQIEQLRRGVDVLVATPGRLLDHAGQKTVDLSAVEILVLDEGDRMLDMGFVRDIRRIINLLPKLRRNLLFSATFPDEIRRLAEDMMNSPVRIDIERKTLDADLVNQRVHPVDRDKKRAALSHLIRTEEWSQVLVFARTKHGANRLADLLTRDGLPAAAIHGNKSQGARTMALSDFKTGRARILVATDLASRGLDIEQLPCVVNYELPQVPEDYVHRIGRTGRAGKTGLAVSLVSIEEHGMLLDIEKLLQHDIPQVVITGFEPAVPFVIRPKNAAAPGRPGRGSGRSTVRSFSPSPRRR